MKKIIIGVAALTLSLTAMSQTVTVNGADLNEKSYIDVYTCVKPMSSKICVFVDTGDNKLKVVNYDLTKNQKVIYDGKRLKPGNVMKFKKYLTMNGWKISDKTDSNIGNVKILVTTYTK